MKNANSDGHVPPNPSPFSISIQNDIAHIILNQPDSYNAMTKAFWNEIPDIVEDIDINAKARVIVVSSTGKHFSAGMDLAVFGDVTPGADGQHDRYIAAEAFRSNIRQIQRSFSAFENARMPVLFACQGGVIGGAIDMVSAGDIRWCTKDAFFTIQEINIGMTADVGTFPRLQRLIPEGWLREMAYTGMRVDAAQAEKIGLVNGVFEDHAAMLSHVMSVAQEIASKSPLAVTGSKVMMNYARDHSTADTLDYIGLWNASMLAPEHLGEAMMARKDKRKANFPNLAPLRKTAL